LLGGKGAGKTTTIGMIMGLIEPTSCSIHAFGHDMAHERHYVLGRMNFEGGHACPRAARDRQAPSIWLAVDKGWLKWTWAETRLPRIAAHSKTSDTGYHARCQWTSPRQVAHREGEMVP